MLKQRHDSLRYGIGICPGCLNDESDLKISK